MSSVDLHLSVEDTGIGIPESEKEKIFEAFTQISGQSIKKYGGTGLGLSITKKLVEMMNGKISIESEVGKGSIFHVEFANVQIVDIRIPARRNGQLLLLEIQVLKCNHTCRR